MQAIAVKIKVDQFLINKTAWLLTDSDKNNVAEKECKAEKMPVLR